MAAVVRPRCTSPSGRCYAPVLLVRNTIVGAQRRAWHDAKRARTSASSVCEPECTLPVKRVLDQRRLLAAFPRG
jgi:hypothetical protein